VLLTFTLKRTTLGFLMFTASRQQAVSAQTTLATCQDCYLFDGTNIIVGDMNCGDIDWVNYVRLVIQSRMYSCLLLHVGFHSS